MGVSASRAASHLTKTGLVFTPWAIVVVRGAVGTEAGVDSEVLTMLGFVSSNSGRRYNSDLSSFAFAEFLTKF
jgi:hypothetical protein